MDHLKLLKEQTETDKETQEKTQNVEEEDKKVLSLPNSKSTIMGTHHLKISKQINYFQSPVINNTLLNSLASIKPMSLQENNQSFVIGISGGVSAGKSIVTNLIYQSLKTKFNLSVANLIQSDFYKDIPIDTSPNKLSRNEVLKNYNFDEPGAIDWEHFERALTSLIHNKPCTAPVYDMEQEKRSKEIQDYRTADVIIVEGTLIFAHEHIRKLYNLKIFLDTDEDIRLSRRIYKDVCIRGRDVETVVNRYLKFTKVGFEKYTLPSKKYADIIIPNYGGGYSASHSEEILAGFGSIENAALEVIINQIVAKRVELKKKQ